MPINPTPTMPILTIDIFLYFQEFAFFTVFTVCLVFTT